jgi:dienelactone hydrolase
MYFLDRGYVVLNLDSFGTRGTSGGTVCESTSRLVSALDYRTHDAFDALRYMRTLPYVNSRNVFLMGQSNGGSVAINAAKMTGRDGFRAVAAYYPWCGSLGGSTVKLTSPLIIFSGGRDDWVPARQCRNKHAVGAALKVIEYANAAHSFDLQIPPQRYLGKLIGYDKPATENSRAHMLAFFNGTLAPRQLADKASPSPDGATESLIALADKASPSADVTVEDLAALVAAWTGDSEISWFE